MSEHVGEGAAPIDSESKAAACSRTFHAEDDAALSTTRFKAKLTEKKYNSSRLMEAEKPVP